MHKLNELVAASETEDVENEWKKTENEEINEKKLFPTVSSVSCNYGTEASEKEISSPEDFKKDILKLTMLFNKYNSDLDKKRNSKIGEDDDRRRKDVKFTMFFNKDVTIRNHVDQPKSLEGKNAGSPEKSSKPPISVSVRNKPKFSYRWASEPEFGKPQISEPAMMFLESLTFPSFAEDGKFVSQARELENIRKIHLQRTPKMDPESLLQWNVYPEKRADLRLHNSLTSLSKNNKLAFKGVLKSKIPSLTAIENSILQNVDFPRYGYWDHCDDLILVQSDPDKKFNLQISRSSNDYNRRSGVKLKKEEGTSVSDSKLFCGDFESKKQIKKSDKKSKGDSSKKKKDCGGKKQVQWKTEVDVIYFSTYLAVNGDRTGEVIGRVMEPLREEWEQQRKGFYAKTVPYHMESQLKDRFISLLKMQTLSFQIRK